MNTSNGLLNCAAYAFAPNYYQYCGPDQNNELLAHLFSKESDPKLKKMLQDFGTLYSYLKTIARANRIGDPFDPRVVEAYWIGNDLLEQVSEQDIFNELIEGQNLKKRLSKNDLKWLFPKIPQGAKLHHSFHVFNVFTRTGHHTVPHTVKTMDECRISWGKISQISNVKSHIYNLKVKTQQIIYENSKLIIKNNVIKEIKLPYKDIVLKPGDIVTSHWGWYCGHINSQQAKQLEYYTKIHLELANKTL